MTSMTGPPWQADPEQGASASRSTNPARRLLRGDAADPAWARPALLGLLAATAVLYVWGLGASGWANSFYSAAVQAGTRSWKAFFFGSSDAANFITVDKTPMALWPMELSARIFGVNAWSILVPQALMGVATVGVLYAAVRRSLGRRGERVRTAERGDQIATGEHGEWVPTGGHGERVETSGPGERVETSGSDERVAAGGSNERVAAGGRREWPPTGGPDGRVETGSPGERVETSGRGDRVAIGGRGDRVAIGGRGDRVAIGGALLAGAVLATTPVAALMFRFNNPDALLVLLLTLGAYGLVRALENASTHWLVIAASCVGLAFLAKMMQAFLVVPAFALVYLLLAPAPIWRRVRQLLLAGVALVVAAGWWVAIVALVPAGSRPYIGGSQHDSVLELALGYNGLGRLNGNETGGLGNLNQDAGWMRMFDAELGGQIAWLLPAALVLLVAGVALTWGRDRRREFAGFALWGGWLLVTGLVFSFMQGIFHGYYTIALAPAVAALTGMGAATLWRERRRPAAAVPLAGAVALTAWWSYVLLGRSPDFLPWLRIVVLVGGLLAAALLASVGRAPRRLIGAAVAVAALTSIAGPAAYAVETADTPHTGAIPTAGPSSGGPGGMPGFGGRRGGPGARGGFGGGRQNRFPGGGFPGGGQVGNGQARGGFPGGGFTRGGQGGTGGMPQAPGGAGGGMGGPGSTGRPGGMGGPGGLLNATTPSAALTALLKQNARSYTWVAATVGSNNASGYQLATGAPIMALGGFNGTDPAPSLQRFQQYVAAGRIHYFIGGSGIGMMRGGNSSGSDDAQQIATWVQQHYTAKTVGGITVYDLSQTR
ncbi:glycosyltransferase family 39 protein [Actinoallomurus sp. NPDC050550]|uniref:glycosyltransferase family 39 protein n=1 Tax=Actinoallomurus sp. NPDC050550 TaxID=3154937 RepID=UPI0034002CB8